ncbi:MAG: hypothetical protein HY899_12320 [Deltaproteobacteria bacterium]|nr:hypothetical protein [Deltaproteobacteria bacterium]
MSENDVQLTGSGNTMAVIALVAAILSLALNFWNIDRTNGLQASIAVDKINAAAAAKKAAGS